LESSKCLETSRVPTHSHFHLSFLGVISFATYLIFSIEKLFNFKSKVMDATSTRIPVYLSPPRSISESLISEESSNSLEGAFVLRKREALAWLIIALQSCAICFLIQGNLLFGLPNKTQTFERRNVSSPFSINNKPPIYHENQFLRANSGQDPISIPFYDPPTHYPPDAGLVSRVWHSNGSPKVNEGLHTGTCWCSGDNYCMCTPALAIDLILTSGPDHVWLVRRKDKDLMALMGGFNEVGETVEEASRRELREEMNIDLPGQPLTLFGVYSDPLRDSRKHAVSVVFHIDIPPHIAPTPGDDASEVVRMPLSAVDSLEMFIDHKTVLRDFIRMKQIQKEDNDSKTGNGIVLMPNDNDGEPFKRSVCAISAL
jgi:8-oxo-dGTP diphosphatase